MNTIILLPSGIRPSTLLLLLCLLGCSSTPETLSVEQQVATNIVNMNATQRGDVAATADAPVAAGTAESTERSNLLRQQLEVEIGWRCPDGLDGQRLRVANWSTYIAENTIAHFEALCEVTVEYIEFGGSDELLEWVRSGEQSFDVVVPSDVDVALFIQEGLLIPLDHRLLPGMRNLNPALLNRNFDPVNAYSIPYLWGTVGLAYNTSTVHTGLERWSDLFDASTYQIGWLLSGREMLGIALLVLGYDVNTDQPEEIQQARDYLAAAFGDNVRFVNDDEGQDLLASGELDIVVEYNGDIFQVLMDCGCNRYRYTIPQEGTMVWIDALVIPASTEHPRLAHAFIDYLLQPRVAADIANFTAYATANRAALNRGLIDETMTANTAIYPTEESYDSLYSLISTPELDSLYFEAWNTVLLSAGVSP